LLDQSKLARPGNPDRCADLAVADAVRPGLKSGAMNAQQSEETDFLASGLATGRPRPTDARGQREERSDRSRAKAHAADESNIMHGVSKPLPSS
jgi:hypothetical protein